jgi:hypothetical protein
MVGGGGSDRKPVGLGPSDGDHWRPRWTSGARWGEDPLKAMPMDAGGRNEAGQPVEQLQGSEAMRLATVQIGLGEPGDSRNPTEPDLTETSLRNPPAPFVRGDRPRRGSHLCRRAMASRTSLLASAKA